MKQILGSFDLPTISILVTVILASAGWLVTHRTNHNLARRKEKLELINKRLDDFYGPLYVSTKAGGIAYSALLKKLGRTDDIFAEGRKPTEQELSEWFIWMKNVFMPLNVIRERLIVDNAYLIREPEMPQCLLDFVTHVVGYCAILAKWEKGDLSEHYSIIEFPPELDEYAARSYSELKKEQARLIGLTQK